MVRGLELCCLFALVNCGSDAVTRSGLGEPVLLRVGQSAELSGEGVHLGVSGVSEDSRCPERVVCVWAGVAVVDVWLATSGGPRQELRLSTGPFSGLAPAAEAAGYEVELLDVAPGKSSTLRPSDYRITLVVRRK